MTPTYEIAYLAAAGNAASLRKEAEYLPPEIGKKLVAKAKDIESAWNAMDWQALVELRVLSVRQAIKLSEEAGE